MLSNIKNNKLNTKELSFKEVDDVFNILMTSINLLLLTFSPLLGYIFSMSYLLIFSNYITKKIRVINSLILILNLAIIASSRVYFETPSDDFLRYYDTYKDLLNGNYSEILSYSNGLEWGLPLFYAIIAIISGIESPVFVLFSESLFILILFYYWIESYFAERLNNKDINKLVATAFLFFSIGMMTQVTRQFLSMVILLYAFKYKGMKSYIFLFLATGVHLVALPIFILIKLIQRRPIFYGAVFLVSILLFVQFFPLILQHINLQLPLFSKLLYYAVNNLHDEKINIKILILLFTISIGLYTHRPIGFLKEWRNVFLIFSLAFIFLIPIQLASIRFTLITTFILLGVFFFFAFRQYKFVYTAVIVAYIWYRFISLMSVDVSSPFHLWGSYSWIGTPFYYLLGSYL